MIIQLEGTTAKDVAAAQQSLEALAQSWGYQIAEGPAEATAAATVRRENGKVIDPVSLTALVLSIPSTALAVEDLVDRIRKRRRAKELIDHAQQLAGQQVIVSVTSRSRTVEVRTLDPDQLLDLLAGDDPASCSQLAGPAAPQCLFRKRPATFPAGGAVLIEFRAHTPLTHSGRSASIQTGSGAGRGLCTARRVCRALPGLAAPPGAAPGTGQRLGAPR